MKDSASLGQRVAALRQRQDLTQRQLADRAGISATFVSDVENNKRNVSSMVLLEIAEALGTSLDYLMKGESHNNEEASSKPRSVPPELEAAAQNQGWTYSDAVALLDAKQVVLARRSSSRSASRDVEQLNREDWIRLYDNLIDD